MMTVDLVVPRASFWELFYVARYGPERAGERGKRLAKFLAQLGLFANDYAEFLYLAFWIYASFGEFISLAMKFTEKFCEGLSLVPVEQPLRLHEMSYK